MNILVLNNQEVQQVLKIDELIEVLEEGFRELSDGKVIAPKRTELVVPNSGYLLTMPAWTPGHNLTVKLITVFHGNLHYGLPGHQALMCAFDPETGTPVAIMDGAYITAMRTAGASALSAKILARQNAKVLCIIGAGAQGRSHLNVVATVRSFEEIRITSDPIADAYTLASEHPKVRVFESCEDAVRGADVVCCCTSSKTPVIEFDWLSRGTHVTSVGFSPPGSELPQELVKRGKLYVETRLAFEPPPTGCAELNGLDPKAAGELGEVLSGKFPGRLTEDEITVYKSMGHAMEDMVAMDHVFQRARQQKKGTEITF